LRAFSGLNLAIGLGFGSTFSLTGDKSLLMLGFLGDGFTDCFLGEATLLGDGALTDFLGEGILGTVFLIGGRGAFVSILRSSTLVCFGGEMLLLESFLLYSQ